MPNKDTSFADLLARKKKKPVEKKASDVALPVKGGRQTVPDGVSSLGGFLAEMASVKADFNIQLLGAMEKLSIYNGDVSYAVDNLKQLGNTVGTFPTNIKFDDGVSDELIKEMTARLKTNSKKWYKGGVNSIVNDFLAQIAINGALSGEIIPNDKLDGVKKIVQVAPKSIRFKYDKEQEDYVAYQITDKIGGEGLQVLNNLTYKYNALHTISEKPYGVPPFISALENVSISRDMTENLKHVVKKLGVLGFLEVLVNGPKPKQGEDDEDYLKRTEHYLSRVVPEIEKGMNKGYVVGFKGMHEFKMQNTSSNIQGAKELIEVNDVKLFSALKQDPLMFGRNFSTTETLGRVVLAKMTTQVTNYQKLLENFLEEIFLLDLQLAGYAIENVEVLFDAPMISDRGKEQETRGKLIANLKFEYAQGIISQEVMAQELGREKPDQEEPRALQPTAINPNIVPKEEEPKGKEGVTKIDDKKKKEKKSNIKVSKWELQALSTSLGGHIKEYEYDTIGCSCGEHHIEQLSVGDDPETLDDFISLYYTATSTNLTKASIKASKEIAEALTQLGDNAPLSHVTDSILFTLYKNWGENFSAPQKKIIDKFIKNIYVFFRKDKSIFKGKTGIPNSVFNTVDLRAIDYYKAADSMYLGKFVTDADLKKKITKYLKDEYLEGDLPIGNNAKSMAKFRKEFGDEILKGQDWKLSRIISTTVNKMRNTAAVSYMQQAEVEHFEIVGINDRLQCAYCAAMQGMEFSVEKAVQQVDGAVNSDPSIIGVDTPFITSVYKKADDMAGLTGAELQDAGIALPPYHPHCRDQIVAIL